MTRRKDPRPETPAETAPPAIDDPSAVIPDAQDVSSAIPEPLPAEPTPEIAPVVPPDPTPAPQPRRSGVLGPILGGVIAATAGFALSHFNLLGLARFDNSDDLAAVAARQDEAEVRQAAALVKADAELVALASRVSALETAPAPAAPDLSRLDALEQRLAAIEAAPTEGAGADAALTTRLADLERRLSALPAAGTPPEIQQQLEEAVARLDAAEAEAKARAAEAERAAEGARRATALDALSAAVEAGRPFAAELQALADPALTSVLGTHADEGVPTVADLQATFPDAAREALRIARDLSAQDGWSDRVLDFLAAQTEARPLTPQEGSAPEAILSRAEFALSEARIADALAELAALDPAVRVPFDAWITAASAQVKASAALQSARGE